MGIKKIGISEDLWNALLKFQSNILFNDYYLVGGTAFSLQIGHRISTDIDLFSKLKIKKDEILNFVEKNISKNIDVTNSSNSIFQIVIDKKTKIDFVEYPYDLLDPLIKTDGIRMIGKNDISAMKISAVGTRGNEAKDFIDVYYLLKYMPIEKMFENFKKKYNTDDIEQYKKSLVYFDEVPMSSWKDVKLINDKLSEKEVKETLEKAVSSMFTETKQSVNKKKRKDPDYDYGR